MVKYYAMVGANEYEIEIDGEDIWVNCEPVEVNLASTGEADLYSILYNGNSYELLLEVSRYNYAVMVRGEQYQVLIEDERTRRLNAARGKSNLPEGEFAIRFFPEVDRTCSPLGVSWAGTRDDRTKVRADAW